MTDIIRYAFQLNRFSGQTDCVYGYCARIVPSNGICRGFAFKYGKFLLSPRFLTALSVPKVPTREQ
jgi:hypothetical protein